MNRATRSRLGLAALRYWVLVGCIAALGTFARADALRVGFTVDDYAQLAMMKGVYPVARAPLELFTFSNGAAAENRALQRTGFFPWWSHPALRISMCRPLSSALMWLDLSLFGLDAFAYHLHTLLWWLGMLAALAALLRRVLPENVALLALCVFVAHDAHAMLLGWIAMRNSVVASAFALLGLLFLVRARDDGMRAGRWLALASFALALLASEYAVAFLGYAVLLELLADGARRARLLRLWPLGTLCVAYFALRAAFGFGSYASGMYIDPVAETSAYVSAAVARLPALVGDLVFAVRANWWTAGLPWAPELAQRGVIPARWAEDLLPLRAVQQAVGVLAMLVLALLTRASCNDTAPALRGGASRAPTLRGARFLLLGTALALLPVASSLPESRLLGPALVGWSVVLASTLQRVLARVRSRERHGGAWFAAGAAVLFTLYQISIPGWYGWVDSRLGARMAEAVRKSILAPELDALLRDARHVLLIGAADPTTTIYLPLMRRIHDRPAPRSCQLLAGTFAPHRLERVARNAFVLERLHDGYTAGDVYASAFNRAPLHAGEHFEILGLRVNVVRAVAGRAMRTRYELDRPLEDASIVLLQQTLFGLQRVAFPPLGQSVVLAPPIPPFALAR